MISQETEEFFRKAVGSIFMRDRILELFEEKVESQYPRPPTVNLIVDQELTFTDAYGMKFVAMVRRMASGTRHREDGSINNPCLDFVDEHIANLQEIMKRYREGERENNPCQKGHTWEQLDDDTILCFECDARRKVDE
jgi:hypothetical protein